MVLPDIAPVMAQSSVPARSCGTVSDSGSSSGTAPSDSTTSASVVPATRTRRPRKSSSVANGCLQNTTCAG